MKQADIKLKGYEMLEKIVNRSGDSGRVYVPLKWVGKKVKVILLQK